MAKAKKGKTGKNVKNGKESKKLDKVKVGGISKKKVPPKPKVVVKLEPDEFTFTYRDLDQVLEAEKDAVDCGMSLSEYVRKVRPEIPMDIKPKIEPVVKQETDDLDPDPESNDLNLRDDAVVKYEILDDPTSKEQPNKKSKECPICHKKCKDSNGLRKHAYVHKEKTLKCDVCDKLFNRTSSLKLHKSTHLQNRKKYSCEICHKELQSKGILQKHRKIHDASSKVHECQICHRKFGRLFSLRGHIQRVHEINEKKKCSFCDKKFTNDYHRIAHMRTEHFALLRQSDKGTGDLHPLFNGRRTYECYRCKLTGNSDSVKNHMRKCEGKRKVYIRTIKCELCSNLYADKASLITHMRTIHSIHLTREAVKNFRIEKPHKCPFCNKSFSKRPQQSVHIRTEHFGFLRQQDKGTGNLHELFQEIRTYECYRCKYSGDHPAVRKHMVSCEGGKRRSVAPFKCEYCNYRYAKKSSILGHMRNFHSNEKIKQAVLGEVEEKEDPKALYQCFDCKSYVSNWNNLKVHTKNHYRPYKCPYCRERFSQNEEKIRHQQEMHSDLIANTINNKYECHVCKQSMRTFEAIKHLADVHQINRFECKICHVKLPSLIRLIRHKAIHSDSRNAVQKEKTLKCDICDKLFRYKSILDRHKSIHLVKQYSCKVCQKEFSRPDGLKLHIQRVHEVKNKHKCQFCDKEFKENYYWFAHMRSEHFALLRQQDKGTGDLHPVFYGRRTYECYRCKYTGNSDSVKNHMRKCEGKRRVYIRTIRCELCPNLYAEKNSLRTHMRNIHSIHLTSREMRNLRIEKPHKCPFCDKSFFQRQKQSIHIRTEHFCLLRKQDKGTGDLHELFQGIRTFECYRCKFSDNHCNVRKHMVSCKGGKRKNVTTFKCEYCNYRYAKKYSILRHMRNIHSNEKIERAVPGKTVEKEDPKALYQCFDCKAYVSNWRVMRAHMRKHYKPLICSYCYERFSHIDEKTKHEQEMHSDLIANTKNKKYECHICKQSMRTTEAIKHLANVHQIKRFECKICHVKLPSLIRLIRHKTIHTREQKHECSICHKEFAVRDRLKKHERHVHQEKSQKCTFCDKKFGTKLYLTAHIRIEHFGLLRQLDKGTGDLHEWFQGNRTYECYRCKWSTSTINEVKRHMGFCEGIVYKPIKCEFCDMRFTNNRNLRGHMQRIHSIDEVKRRREQMLRKAEKVFECIDCKACFASRIGLVQHMQSRCPKRFEYPCDYCFQKFQRKIDKDDHQSRVHPILLQSSQDSKYECHVCKVSMPVRMAIRHLAKKHQIRTVFKLNICRLESPKLVENP